MANRPVFISDEACCVKAVDTEFVYFNGFSKAQRQRSISSLHEAFTKRYPGFKVLEVSSFSENDLGVALSAFNLKISLNDGRKVPVELAFQAGKVFENGGPYKDLLVTTPGNAKRDPRLSESGRIISFDFEGKAFDTEPRTLFYTWLYIKALKENKELADRLMAFDAFTDIVFNPRKSINCQAYACAVYTALRNKGEVDHAVNDISFLSEMLQRASGIPELPLSPEKTNSKRASSSKPQQRTESKSEDIPIKEVSFPSIFKKYDIIEHPKYGRGVVRKIIKKETYAHLIVWFDSIKETKQLMESWVRLNCKFVIPDEETTSSQYIRVEIDNTPDEKKLFDHFQHKMHPLTNEMKATLRLAESNFDNRVSFAVLADHVLMVLFPGQATDFVSIKKAASRKKNEILSSHPDFETASAGDQMFMVVMGGNVICVIPSEGEEDLSFGKAIFHRQEILEACEQHVIYGVAIGREAGETGDGDLSPKS